MTTSTPAEAAGTVDDAAVERLRGHLEALYPPSVAASTLDRLVRLLDRFLVGRASPARDAVLFDETDVVLITYADQVREPHRPPLQTLRDFLDDHVKGVVTGVHLLPHYPATSDDGFAVSDYLRVDPALGGWRDVLRLGQDYRLMLDAVINHTSASSSWFRGWVRGERPFEDFFICLPPDADIRGVTRPRTSPVLTPVDTVHGQRWVWTTFSSDQVDLNYKNPEVLLAICEVLLSYIEHGASMLRLDAVAFLWKELGTSCIHLDKTHEVVRLWRTIIDAVAPGTLIITETNVPHPENVSYFGNGADEAHLVYQFPLAPLTLSAFHLADASTLSEWLQTLSTPSSQTSFLNFLGSHDGIGVRPAEGLLTPSEIGQLCALAQEHGGGVSYKANPDGSMSPYELNTVYFDALTPAESVEPTSRQVDRFLAAQSILLSLAGVPAVHVNALLGSRNWAEGVRGSGRLRSINRQKFDRATLEAELADPQSLRHEVFTRFRERIAARISEPAFHPDGAQRVLPTEPSLLAFERTAVDGSSSVLCIHNVSGRPQSFTAGHADGLAPDTKFVDLCQGGRYRTGPDGALELSLPPYGVRWLRRAGSS